MRFLVDMPVTPQAVPHLVRKATRLPTPRISAWPPSPIRPCSSTLGSTRRHHRRSRLPRLLATHKAETPGVILFRGGSYSDADKNRRLLRRLQAIERLPRRDQQALLRTIDRFLESFQPE